MVDASIEHMTNLIDRNAYSVKPPLEGDDRMIDLLERLIPPPVKEAAERAIATGSWRRKDIYSHGSRVSITGHEFTTFFRLAGEWGDARLPPSVELFDYYGPEVEKLNAYVVSVHSMNYRISMAKSIARSVLRDCKTAVRIWGNFPVLRQYLEVEEYVKAKPVKRIPPVGSAEGRAALDDANVMAMLGLIIGGSIDPCTKRAYDALTITEVVYTHDKMTITHADRMAIASNKKAP